MELMPSRCWPGRPVVCKKHGVVVGLGTERKDCMFDAHNYEPLDQHIKWIGENAFTEDETSITKFSEVLLLTYTFHWRLLTLKIGI